MQTKVVKINGKEVSFNANNSGWISEPLPEGFSKEFLMNLPRLRYNSKKIPTVLLGHQEVKLGTQFLTEAERKEFNAHNCETRGSSSGGTRTVVKEVIPEDALNALVEWSKTLPEEAQAGFSAWRDQYAPDPELVTLMSLGFTLEQAKQALALKK